MCYTILYIYIYIHMCVYIYIYTHMITGYLPRPPFRGPSRDRRRRRRQQPAAIVRALSIYYSISVCITGMLICMYIYIYMYVYIYIYMPFSDQALSVQMFPSSCEVPSPHGRRLPDPVATNSPACEQWMYVCMYMYIYIYIYILYRGRERERERERERDV